jgi:hypothetical protein
LEKRIVHLFVFDTLSDWEPSFAVAGLNNPAFQATPGRYQVKTVGVSTQPVTTIGGLTLFVERYSGIGRPTQIEIESYCEKSR